MRRLFMAVTLCTAFLLLTAGVAVAGASMGSTVVKDGGASATTLQAIRAQHDAAAPWPSVKARFIPAPEAVVAAAAAIDGTILDYYGSGWASASVHWYAGSTARGSGRTDGSGHFSFPSATPTSGKGEITAISSDETTWYDWWNLSWASPGPTTFDLQPGAVNTTTSTGGPWGPYVNGISTDIYTSEGPGFKDTFQYFDGSTSAAAPVLPGTIQGMGVYFFNGEGAEVPELNGLTVTAGATLAESAAVDEVSAQRVWTGGASSDLSKPWGSGKPGSRLKVWLQDFPTSWTNHISGYSDNPSNSAPKNFGNFRSLRASAHARTLTVPAKAVPGYGYRLWIDHTQGALQLTTWFQVCTLKASKTTINKGAAIRLTGVVPVQDHVGSTAGTRTTVYCFAHKGAAGQPTNLDPTKQHWQYVGSFKTDGYGKFRTPLLKPNLTLTVVMAYPGDAWYNAAFTSPVKVTVH